MVGWLGEPVKRRSAGAFDPWPGAPSSLRTGTADAVSADLVIETSARAVSADANEAMSFAASGSGVVVLIVAVFASVAAVAAGSIVPVTVITV